MVPLNVQMVWKVEELEHVTVFQANEPDRPSPARRRRYEKGGAANAAPPSSGVSGGAARQCAWAPSAPMPVSERTNCASKAARSRSARRDVSSFETIQIVAKASGIENNAGLS